MGTLLLRREKLKAQGVVGFNSVFQELGSLLIVARLSLATLRRGSRDALREQEHPRKGLSPRRRTALIGPSKKKNKEGCPVLGSFCRGLLADGYRGFEQGLHVLSGSFNWVRVFLHFGV
ncbi:hypothetical protein NL676_031097 [Syzygium grande]|nr:hypothetical protein NL676_031097 [Syzygium grande]